MPYLIDGNNLIGAIRVIDIRDPAAREKLIRLLGRFQRARNKKVVVVFDGPPPPGARPVTNFGGLTAIYAGPEKDADTRIRQILEESSDPKSFTVVSSDRQVYSFARWKGANAVRVMSFYKDLRSSLERLDSRNPQREELTPDEVHEWLDYFGFSNEDEC